MSVHNHGPNEGRGLDCGESVVDGELKGWCMRTARTPADDAGEVRRLRAREQWIVRRLWVAFGCEANPDDFKESVRDNLVTRMANMAATAEDNDRAFMRDARAQIDHWHSAALAATEGETRAEAERDEARAEADSLRAEVERLTQQRSRLYDDVANTRSWADSIRIERDSLRVTLAAVGGVIRNIRTRADQSATHHPSVLHSIANDLLAIITPPRTCRPVYGSCGLESGHPGAHNARALAADPVSLADVLDGGDR